MVLRSATISTRNTFHNEISLYNATNCKYVIYQIFTMSSLATKLSANGRIVLPAKIRASLGLKEGDELLISIADGEIRITPKALALQNALALARKHLSDSPSLSDALIADRRAEAADD